jgi:hypothetical protein
VDSDRLVLESLLTTLSEFEESEQLRRYSNWFTGWETGNSSLLSLGGKRFLLSRDPYAMDIRGHFLGCKAAGAWSWSSTSI